jgi:hypothetical protein
VSEKKIDRGLCLLRLQSPHLSREKLNPVFSSLYPELGIKVKNFTSKPFLLRVFSDKDKRSNDIPLSDYRFSNKKSTNGRKEILLS